MTIKQQGGVFGRHPTFSTADIEGDFTVDGGLFHVDTDTGRIGVGTLAPLDTAGWGRAVDIRGASGSQGSVIYTGTSDAAARAYFGTYATSYALIGTQTNHNMLVWINNQNIGSFTSNGFAPVNGKGIDFSATSGTGTSELFDDYEEGTWTPEFRYTTANDGSFTYAAQTGLYTKFGNLVTVSFEITLSAFSKNTAAGSLLVTGLPYTIASSDKSTGAMSLDNTTFYADPVVVSRPSTTHLYMYRNRSNNTDASFDPSATSRISGSITYRV